MLLRLCDAVCIDNDEGEIVALNQPYYVQWSTTGAVPCSERHLYTNVK